MIYSTVVSAEDTVLGVYQIDYPDSVLHLL